MARTVRDAAILLGALTGVDETDEVTKSSAGKGSKDYTVYLDKQGLKGKRIGMDLKKRSKDFLVNRLNDAAIALMKQQGAEIVDVPFQDDINALGGAELAVLQFEFKDGVNRYLSTAGHQIKTVADVIAYNKANEEKAMPYFKQEILEQCEATKGLGDPKYVQALKDSRDGSRKIIDTLIATHKLDAFAGITMGPACSIDVMYGDRWGADSLTAPAAMSGFPHITVPCGMANRLPVGFSFFGAAYAEPALIAIAYAFEQADAKRQKPGFIPSFLD
jgi:amidase